MIANVVLSSQAPSKVRDSQITMTSISYKTMSVILLGVWLEKEASAKASDLH